MSVRFQSLKPIPSRTVAVAKAALGDDNLILKLRDELGTFYQNTDFAELFSHEGQPGICPWRLAMVCVLQYLDNLSDRGAAEAVRTGLKIFLRTLKQRSDRELRILLFAIALYQSSLA